MSSLLQEEDEEKARAAFASNQEEAHKPILHALLTNRMKLKEILHRAGEIKQTLNWERELEGFRETLSVEIGRKLFWDRYLL